MGKKQLGIRIPDSLLERLEDYAKEQKTSKTEIVIGAIAKYLDSSEIRPLGERVRVLEEKLRAVESKRKEIGTQN